MDVGGGLAGRLFSGFGGGVAVSGPSPEQAQPAPAAVGGATDVRLGREHTWVPSLVGDVRWRGLRPRPRAWPGRPGPARVQRGEGLCAVDEGLGQVR